MLLFDSKDYTRRFAILRAVLILLIAASWTTLFVDAQINTGRITGVVTDSGGAVIVGATVRATNQATSVVTTVQSQENGNYLLNFLIPGRYTVEAESAGFETSVVKDVEATAGGIARNDFQMRIGQVHQT